MYTFFGEKKSTFKYIKNCNYIFKIECLFPGKKKLLDILNIYY